MRPMLAWIEHEREAISARTKAGAGPKLPIMEPGSSADDASAKGDGGFGKEEDCSRDGGLAHGARLDSAFGVQKRRWSNLQLDMNRAGSGGASGSPV